MNKHLKILIPTEFYLPLICGVTTAVLNQKRALEALGHEVRILTISGEKKSYYKDGVYYFRSNIPQLYKDSYATLAFNDPMINDIYAWKPDIVHTQCEFFTMVFAKKIAKKLDIPLILTSHTDYDSYGIHFMKSQKLWKKITKTFIPKCIKKADHIICVTNKNYEILSSYGVKNKMEIIPVGLDLDQFKQRLSKDERVLMRSKYGFTDDDLVLVSVCRLSEEKNVKESIDHFASLIKHYDKVKLLIVGDGTAKDALENQVKDLSLQDSVKFTGGVEMADVWKYYQLGEIFISSSLSEIQGLTYIEALASGLPIVCRKDPSLKMSLIEGVNGYDFITDEEFLTKIKPLIEDESFRRKMSQNASESVEKYSIEQFGKNLMRVYEEELEIRKRG